MSDDQILEYFKLQGKWGNELFVALFILLPVLAFLLLALGNIIGWESLPSLIFLGISFIIGYCFITFDKVQNRRKQIINLLKEHLDGIVGELNVDQQII